MNTPLSMLSFSSLPVSNESSVPSQCRLFVAHLPPVADGKDSPQDMSWHIVVSTSQTHACQRSGLNAIWHIKVLTFGNAPLTEKCACTFGDLDTANNSLVEKIVENWRVISEHLINPVAYSFVDSVAKGHILHIITRREICKHHVDWLTLTIAWQKLAYGSIQRHKGTRFDTVTSVLTNRPTNFLLVIFFASSCGKDSNMLSAKPKAVWNKWEPVALRSFRVRLPLIVHGKTAAKPLPSIHAEIRHCGHKQAKIRHHGHKHQHVHVQNYLMSCSCRGSFTVGEAWSEGPMFLASFS